MIHREISDKRFQIDSLDGLRGFAALMVVISHTSMSGFYFVPFLNLSGVGKSGVFLFFLLSSFLLTLPLLHKGREIVTFPVMFHYWQRRFFRIYPLYILYLLLGVTSTWFYSTVLGKNGVGIPFDLDLYGLLNHLALQEGKGVTWSIAVEFKFYFLLPLLALIIVFVRSYGLRPTILFFLLLLLLSQIISPESRSVTNDLRLLPYMPIFLFGMFLAFLQNYINSNAGQTEKLKKTYKYLGYVGVVGIIFMTPLIVSAFRERVPNNYFHKQFILYALFWSFVLLSAVNVQGLLQKFFTLPILRFYGALSFSLYLFHPIFIKLMERFKVNDYLSAWLVLLISTIAAYISFTSLERPISKYKVSQELLSSLFTYNKSVS